MNNKLNLSDNEKRDIIRYLESGKLLPDKYRFLLFDTDREVELLWNGKTDEVTNLILPFQTVEHIDEPRSEETLKMQNQLFDTSGQQIQGWTNKLIWGDNKLILSSLKNGPLRKEIEAQGGLKLIYIDPPFDVGADFSMNIEIGEESFTKKPSVIEEIAYRDTWGKGTDSFIAMIYERLKLMHGLLADDGSIYVHCDWRVSSYMKMVLDEIFGQNNLQRQIAFSTGWALGFKTSTDNWIKQHEVILYYSKNANNKIFNKQYRPYTVDYNARARKDEDGKLWVDQSLGSISKQKLEEMKLQGRAYQTSTGNWRKKQYLDEMQGEIVGDIWTDINPINSQAKENLGYPTQKAEFLLERIIKASSNEGDLIADFFCGSGTTLAVAEKLGRKWIGSDLGRFSIHTTRKRMIGVQRELKKSGKGFRPFEILNIGKYEREYYVGVEKDLRQEEKQKVLERKEKEFVKLILTAYKAEPVNSFTSFVGKRRDRLVAVGPINNPVASGFIDEIISECQAKNIAKVDILGFDYEMGIDFSEFKNQGLDLQFKIIPREVFDKQAVEKGQVKFYDVAYIEVKPIIKRISKKNTIAVELCDFSVFYNQDDTGEIEEKLQSGGSKIIIEDGKVIKVTKDKQSDIIERAVLTQKWTDWVDYWAVDFDFAFVWELPAHY